MLHRDFILNHSGELAEILDFAYGSPDHNNKKDPLDELVFILLSRRTRDVGYERVYDELKEHFPDWSNVVEAPDHDLHRIIDSAGLGGKRVEEIRGNLRIIHNRFGRYSLENLREWSNRKIFEFLTSLKGIGPKSTYCIMMYSLGRQVFPVDTHVNRICQRLGIIESGLNHKKAQVLLEDVFPQSLRYKLHVNMLAHGRATCHPRNPACHECIIAGFCKYTRNGTSRRNDIPGFIDLFAGAGGMSLGFERAGFDLRLAVESNTRAISTFLFNRQYLESDRALNDRMENVAPEDYLNEKIKVIVAGPPCQEFSEVRKNSNSKTGRNELYREVLRFVAEILPTFVVIENVPGMINRVNKRYAEKISNGLIELGYVVHAEKINACEYGVPQNRHRIFFIARRIFRGSENAAKKALDRVWKRIHESRDPRIVKFSQAISGLPALPPGGGRNIMSNDRRGRRSEYAIKLECNGGAVFNHQARKHNARDREAYSLMEEGENALDLHRKRPDLMRYSTRNFPTKYFKIRNDHPSPTIVAHLRKDANSFIHPRDNRGITPREAARLQSFPDNYMFLGTFGLQFEQIGNAVPPILAEVIARTIMDELESGTSTTHTADRDGHQ